MKKLILLLSVSLIIAVTACGNKDNKKDVTNDTEPEIPQTGDDFNPGLFVGLGASALIAGVAMMRGRKKKEDEEETVNQ